MNEKTDSKRSVNHIQFTIDNWPDIILFLNKITDYPYRILAEIFCSEHGPMTASNGEFKLVIFAPLHHETHTFKKGDYFFEIDGMLDSMKESEFKSKYERLNND